MRAVRTPNAPALRRTSLLFLCANGFSLLFLCANGFARFQKH